MLSQTRTVENVNILVYLVFLGSVGLPDTFDVGKNVLTFCVIFNK